MAIPTVSGPDACPMAPYGCYMERTLSPWHEDAFPDEFKQAAPEHGERGEGWMVIDYYENAVGYIPDGTDLKGEHPRDELTDEARKLYAAPFKYNKGYIFSGDHMVADQHEADKMIATTVRGWGELSYKDNGEALQDEVGRRIAYILTKYWNNYVPPAGAEQ